MPPPASGRESVVVRLAPCSRPQASRPSPHIDATRGSVSPKVMHWWGAAGVRLHATTSFRPRGHPSVSMQRGGSVSPKVMHWWGAAGVRPHATTSVRTRERRCAASSVLSSPGLAAIPPYRCDAEGGSPTRWGAAGVRSCATTSVRPRGHPSVSMRRGGSRACALFWDGVRLQASSLC